MPGDEIICIQWAIVNFAFKRCILYQYKIFSCPSATSEQTKLQNDYKIQLVFVYTSLHNYTANYLENKKREVTFGCCFGFAKKIAFSYIEKKMMMSPVTSWHEKWQHK